MFTLRLRFPTLSGVYAVAHLALMRIEDLNDLVISGRFVSGGTLSRGEVGRNPWARRPGFFESRICDSSFKVS